MVWDAIMPTQPYGPMIKIVLEYEYGFIQVTLTESDTNSRWLDRSYMKVFALTCFYTNNVNVWGRDPVSVRILTKSWPWSLFFCQTNRLFFAQDYDFNYKSTTANIWLIHTLTFVSVWLCPWLIVLHLELTIRVSRAYHPILTESTSHTISERYFQSCLVQPYNFDSMFLHFFSLTPFSVLCTALRTLLDWAFSNASNTAEMSFRCSSIPGNPLKYDLDTYEMIINAQSPNSLKMLNLLKKVFEDHKKNKFGFNNSILKSWRLPDS